MNRIRQTISLALVFAMVGLGLTAAQAQRRTYRLSDAQVSQLIRRVEMSTERFQGSLSDALDRGSYGGTTSAGDINSYVQNLQNATAQLRDRFNRRVSVAADVQNVLQQASLVNGFMLNNRVNARVQNDWSLVRTDLNALARAYGITWDWSQAGSTYGTQGYGYPTTTTGQPYRLSDAQIDALLRRIQGESDRFRSDISSSRYNNGGYDNTRAGDNINQFVSDFADATAQLRSRFDSRRSVASDVENVLRQATYVDDFMRRRSPGYRAVNDWSALKGDLNQLASAYNVAWNWDVNSLPGTTAGGNVNGTGGYNNDRGYGVN